MIFLRLFNMIAYFISNSPTIFLYLNVRTAKTASVSNVNLRFKGHQIWTCEKISNVFQFNWILQFKFSNVSDDISLSVSLRRTDKIGLTHIDTSPHHIRVCLLVNWWCPLTHTWCLCLKGLSVSHIELRQTVLFSQSVNTLWSSYRDILCLSRLCVYVICVFMCVFASE